MADDDSDDALELEDNDDGGLQLEDNDDDEGLTLEDNGEDDGEDGLKLEDNDEDGLVLEDNDDGELQLEDNDDSDGLALEDNDEEDGLELEANDADPSTRANLNRSTAQGDATANDTAVLHSFGGLELAAVAASVTAPAASSTDVPVELRFALLYDVRTALMLYRNEH